MSRLEFKWDINYEIPVYDRTPHKKLDAVGVDDNKKTYSAVVPKAEKNLKEQKSKPIINKNYERNPLWKNFEASKLQL